MTFTIPACSLIIGIGIGGLIGLAISNLSNEKTLYFWILSIGLIFISVRGLIKTALEIDHNNSKIDTLIKAYRKKYLSKHQRFTTDINKLTDQLKEDIKEILNKELHN